MTSGNVCTEVLLDEHGKSMKITIPASMTFSSILRDLIGSLIQNDTQFSSKWKHRIQLMADELINNAIEHGSAPGNIVKITLTISNNSDFEIIIEDSGTGKKQINANELMDFVKASREAMTVNPLSNKSIRGRGLAMIVLNWSDDFKYENNSTGGLTARMCKKFTQDCGEKDLKKLNENASIKNQIKVEALVF
ncbi:ATP-binding protein [Candidatus Gracilibacteria bacterium]|nr:ATP-binding protein [Candidatus Gracilibacteria bacterium]